MKLHFIDAYSDNSLKRNEYTKQYQLTKNICLEILGGNPYQNDGELEKRIKLNTYVVYTYILSMGHSLNQKYNLCVLNCTEEGRRLLLQVLTAQFLADAEVGYNDLVKQVPINFSNFTSINQDKILNAILSPLAKMSLLNSSGALDGYNLCSQIKYKSAVLDTYVRKYDI